MPYGINLKQRNRRLNFGNRYALDYIPGGVENNVLWLSYYQMTGRRNDECFRLRDLTTSDEWDIGRINGYVDYIRVLNLLGGHTGLCTKIYNNTWAAGAQDAIQTNVANMPIAAESGVFHHNGFKFVAASSHGLTMTTYAALNITIPSISIYANYYKNNVNSGFIYAKNTEFELLPYESAGNSFTTFRLANIQRNLAIQELVPGINKCVGCWNTKNANGIFTRVNNNTDISTYSGDITGVNNITIGYRNTSLYHDGNIKTISISADNLYNYYNILASRC